MSNRRSRNYNLDKDGFCHRTEVAIRTQTLKGLDWQRFVDGVNASHAKDEENVCAFITKWILRPCYCEIQETIERVRKMDNLPLKAQTLLLQRWAQIKLLLLEAAHSRSITNPL